MIVFVPCRLALNSVPPRNAFRGGCTGNPCRNEGFTRTDVQGPLNFGKDYLCPRGHSE